MSDSKSFNAGYYNAAGEFVNARYSDGSKRKFMNPSEWRTFKRQLENAKRDRYTRRVARQFNMKIRVERTLHNL